MLQPVWTGTCAPIHLTYLSFLILGIHTSTATVKQGICKIEGQKEWTCEKAEECDWMESGETPHSLCGGGLICCPPQVVGRIRRQRHQANAYCEKLLEDCMDLGWITHAGPKTGSSNQMIQLEETGVFPARVKELPFTALIGYGESTNKTWGCTGALISQKYVLTTAHCAERSTGDAKWVRLGGESHGEQLVGVARRLLHPGYRKGVPPLGDIALLELERAATLTSYARPACLHTSPTIPHYRVKAAGWHPTRPGQEGKNLLMNADMFMVNSSDCLKNIEFSERIQNVVCATPIIDYEMVCQGEALGPLFVRLGRRCAHTLLGLSSQASSCRVPFAPRIFTRVHSYLSWIENLVW